MFSLSNRGWQMPPSPPSVRSATDYDINHLDTLILIFKNFTKNSSLKKNYI